MKTKEEKIKWGVPVTRPWSILKHTPWVEWLSKELSNKVGVNLTSHLLVDRGGGKCTSYFDMREWQILSQKLTEMCKDRKYFYEWAAECKKNADKIMKTSEKFRRENLRGKSSEELREMFLEYLKPMKEWAFYGWPLFIVEKILEDMVKKELQSNLEKIGKKDEFAKYFQIITTKIKPNESEEEERDLLRIAVKYSKEG